MVIVLIVGAVDMWIKRIRGAIEEKKHSRNF
jgi:hypothetical protein